MPKVVYKFVADDSGLTTSLAKVSVQLDKVDDAAGKAKKGAKDLGAELGKQKEAVSNLAEGLSRVSPELAGMARGASGALSVLKSLGTALGPVGALALGVTALGAAGLHAFTRWSDGINTAEKQASAAAAEILRQQLGLVDNSDYAGKAIAAIEAASLAKRLGAWERFYITAGEFLEKHKAAQIAAGFLFSDLAGDAARDHEFETNLLDTKAKGLAALAFEAKAAADAQKELTAEQKETANWLAQQADIQAEQDRKAKTSASSRKREKEAEAARTQAAMYAEVQQEFTDADAERDRKQQEFAEDQAQRLKNATDLQAMYAEGYIKTSQDQVAAAEATADITAIVGRGVQDLAHNIQGYGEMSKEAQVALALVARAGALAQIAASTGAAIAQAQLAATIAAAQAAMAAGPAAPIVAVSTFAGLSAGMQASIIASAALSSAAVLSAPIPTRHAGGVSGAGEVVTLQQLGESTLNRATTAYFGREGVNDLNRGNRAAKPTVVTQMVGHRTMDSWWLKSLSRLDSPTRRGMQKVPVGIRFGRRER